MDIFSGAMDYFVKGGACMWPLLVCSISAVVIGIERIRYYAQHITPKKFNFEFAMLMNEFKLEQAKELAEKTKGDTAALAVEIMNIKENLGPRLESIIYAKADRYIEDLEDNLRFLNIIIGISPMLGLLGTITGMMGSFNALNERSANPMAVTSGIGEALITTVFGLIISMIAMCFYGYLISHIKRASLNLYEVGSVLNDIITEKNSGKK